MTGYRVEPSKLRAVSAQLRQSGEHLHSTRTTIDTAAVPDAAFAATRQSPAAVQAWRAALAAFDRRLDKISQRLTHEATSLTTTAAAYERADRHAATLFDRLRIGSTGAAVAELQQHLHNSGINPGPIDGSYGPRTAHAVAEYHRLHPDN